MASLTHGTDEIFQLLRRKLPSHVDDAWIQRCVAVLDSIGRPRNLHAYLLALVALRRFLGWGYRSNWLRSLPAWSHLSQVYAYGSWAAEKDTCLLEHAPAAAVRATPAFLDAGYAETLGALEHHGRLVDCIVLMCLTCGGYGPAGVVIDPAHVDTLAGIAPAGLLKNPGLLHLLSGQGFTGRRRVLLGPRDLLGRWHLEIAKGDSSTLSASIREALAACATVLAAILDGTPQTVTPPPPRRVEEGRQPAPPTTPKATARRRASELPNPATLFQLPVRAPHQSDDSQPEDGVRDVLEIVDEDTINPLLQQQAANLAEEMESDEPASSALPTPADIRRHISARRREGMDRLLVEERPSVLLQDEARRVLIHITERLKDAVAASDQASLGAYLQLALAAVGGMKTWRVRGLRLAPLDRAMAWNDVDVVTPEGYLVRDVPLPPERYRPAAETAGLLTVGTRTVLRLPRELQAPLAAWIALQSLDPIGDDVLLFGADGLSERALSRCGDRIRTATGVRRFSAQRLANALSVVLMAQTNDAPLVQMITSDAQGLSLTGCAYYSPTQGDLQDAWDRALQALGLTPAPGQEVLRAMRVGSQLCLDDAFLRQRIKTLGNGLNYLKRSMHSDDASRVIANHNRMVLYTGWLLQATLATRYAQTMGGLTLDDVSWDPGWVIVDDKAIDIAHRSRAIVLSGLARQQLRALASHLNTLRDDGRLDPGVRAVMHDALEGTRPFLFFIAGDDILAWGREALRRYDEAWTLPMNTLRHRSATQLRKYGCPGDFVAGQLGHVELGHLLGLDSPTPPETFHARVSEAIDAAARADGWTVRYGYGDSAWAPPLMPATRESAASLRRELDRRDVGFIRGECPSGYPRDHAELRAECEQIERLLEVHLRERVPEPPQTRLHLDAACMHDLRQAVAGRYAGDQPRTCWALGVLRNLVLDGETSGKWTCGDRRRVFQYLVEPSPVAVGLMACHRTYRALRRWYIERMPQGVAAEEGDRVWPWWVLGLILIDGHVRRETLAALIGGLHRARRPGADRDMLLVPCPAQEGASEQTLALHGLSAILAVRCQAALVDPPTGDTAWKTFESWLCTNLPEALGAPAAGCTAWLLDITAVAIRLELPGLVRAIRTGLYPSTTLPADATAALYDMRPPHDLAALPDFMGAVRAVTSARRPPVERDPALVAMETALRDVLRCMPVMDYAAMHRIAPDRHAIRQHRIARLGPVIEQYTNHPVAVLLLRYADKLLRHGTPTKRWLADSTIAMYAGDLVAAFVRNSQALPPSGLESLSPGELGMLYATIIASSQSQRLPELLGYFHGFLGECHPRFRMPFSTLVRVPRRSTRIDAAVIPDREYLMALRLLDHAMKIHRTNPDLLWFLEAARAAMILMRRGAMRIGETLGLLHSDVSFIGDRCVVRIESNYWRSLKTPNADRVVVLDPAMGQAERGALEHWLARSVLKNKKRHPVQRSPLFRTREWNGHLINSQTLMNLIGMVLRAVTGHPDARPHWLRHTAASYSALRVLDAHGSISALVPDGLDLPRRRDVVRLRVRHGHSEIATTLLVYIHTTRLVPTAPMAVVESLSDRDLARVLGLRYDHLRRKRADLTAAGRPQNAFLAWILSMRRFHPIVKHGRVSGRIGDSF